MRYALVLLIGLIAINPTYSQANKPHAVILFSDFGASSAAQGLPELMVYSKNQDDNCLVDVGYGRVAKTWIYHTHVQLLMESGSQKAFSIPRPSTQHITLTCRFGRIYFRKPHGKVTAKAFIDEREIRLRSRHIAHRPAGNVTP